MTIADYWVHPMNAKPFRPCEHGSRADLCAKCGAK